MSKGPPKNDDARSLGGRTSQSFVQQRNSNSSTKRKQVFATRLGNGSFFPDGTPERHREVEEMLAPARRGFAMLREMRARGVFCAVWAMSWQALKWAFEQRGGDLSANSVFHILARHADQTGRTWVDSNTIAWQLQTTQPTVLDAIKRLLKRGLIEDTGERIGETRSVRVFQLKMPPENASKRTSGFSAKHTRSAKEALKKRTRSTKEALALYETRARVTRNTEYGKEETVSSSKNELSVSNNSNKDDKDVRPGLSRPNDAGEVWAYMFNGDNDHPEEETAALAKYFSEFEDDDEAERDIEHWLRVNNRKGWRGVTDWRVYLCDTFFKGWFPSQQRKAKRRLK